MKLEVKEEIEITLITSDVYGGDKILDVQKDDIYMITFSNEKTAKDSWVPSSPKGFFNPFALIGLRVKGAKCFQLCGNVGKHKQYDFKINSGEPFIIPKTGKLYFFANDTALWNYHFYKNNKGVFKFNLKWYE